MLTGCRNTDNKNPPLLHPHPVRFGCSCTRGNNTYLLHLAVLMETHQSSRKIDGNRERGRTKKTSLWYFVTILLHSWLSSMLFLAVTVSSVTHLSLSLLLCCWWEGGGGAKWITVRRCRCSVLKFKAPESSTQAAQTTHFCPFSGVRPYIFQ